MSVSTALRRFGTLIVLLAVLGLVGSACTTAEDQVVADRLEEADAAGEEVDPDEVRQQVREEEEAQAEADAAAIANPGDDDVDEPTTDGPDGEGECDGGDCSESADPLDVGGECTEGECTESEEAAPFANGCADVLHQPVPDIPGSYSQIVLNLGSDLPEGAMVAADVDGSLDVISGVVSNGRATVVAGIDQYGDYAVSSVSIDGASIEFAPELTSITVSDLEGTVAGTCAG